MTLLTLGLNHQTAPISLRERIALSGDELSAALSSLRAVDGIAQAAILSTCNRTELYCVLAEAGSAEAPLNWLHEYHRIAPRRIDECLYRHTDAAAVRHLFRVATGLDSLVLGEPQILGQVKEAYQLARAQEALGPPLDRLFQQTFSVAKRVRTDTEIGAHPVSIAFTAVRLAQQVFADLRRATVLLVGAGDTIELAARHLAELGAARLIIANRTVENAQALAQRFSAYAIGLAELPAHLAEADVVISSTASPEPVIRMAEVRRALAARQHRPMFMIDLAVPRDIEPAVAALDDVFLYSIDDLQEVIAGNLRSRQAAAQQAEAIIDLHVDHFMAWWRARDGHGLIRGLREQAERERTAVLAKAQKMLASGRPADEVLSFLAHTLTNKLIHTPTHNLREAARRGDDILMEAALRLYSGHPQSETDSDHDPEPPT